MLTQLLQLNVDWAYSLSDGVGALPSCKKLATGTGEEQEHMGLCVGIPMPEWGNYRHAVARLGPLARGL